MSEKRFTGLLKDGNYYIYDDGELMFRDVVSLLNEQHETITRLEKENEQLKRKMNYTRIVIRNNLPKEMVHRVENGLKMMEKELKDGDDGND